MLRQDELLVRARKAGIVPVLTISDADKAVPLAKALIDGGLDVLEITLRTPAALEAIHEIASSGLDCIVGAGTIVTETDVQRAEASGAQFLVTPGTPAELVPALKSFSGPVIPGVATASEAMSRLNEGFDVQKFFPAEANGGAPALKALSGPLGQIQFMPTGGVSLDNMANYLSLKTVVAAGGSWLAPVEDIKAENWTAITTRARQAHEGAAVLRPY
ncbi:MAG: bifunctional 4-hydroxy-2-oxoglutarate aldolase/2-dehydro-3-deoxy-phosphogluconate aldolase [Henriciella sp.]|jgi:2-dehydro-3-deoxyphosphogluconate aldolase/(4S)-4-hydroxy-2-oxoglutarate aldolase